MIDQNVKGTATEIGLRNNEKSRPRARRYAFTLNNYTEDELQKLLDENDLRSLGVKEIGWQEEVGVNNTPHLQGYVEHNICISKKALNKKLFNNRAWLGESQNWNALKLYCQKKSTAIAGTCEIKKPKKLLDILMDKWIEGKWTLSYDTAVSEFLSEMVNEGIVTISRPDHCKELRKVFECKIKNNYVKLFHGNIDYNETLVEHRINERARRSLRVLELE